MRCVHRTSRRVSSVIGELCQGKGQGHGSEILGHHVLPRDNPEISKETKRTVGPEIHRHRMHPLTLSS